LISTTLEIEILRHSEMLVPPARLHGITVYLSKSSFMFFQQMIEMLGSRAWQYTERDAPLANRDALTLLTEYDVIVSSM
jgi:hypothetical protein